MPHTNHPYPSSMQTRARRALSLLGAALLLSASSYGEENCPVEVKLLLSPPTVQAVIDSLEFRKETDGRVYFFDTDALDLLRQGVIVRVRQGANNDLTVKVRIPKAKQTGTLDLGEHFPCEIDRNGDGENTSYSVRRKYKVQHVAEKGSDVANLLSRAQKELLQRAGASIDWSRVTRIADIDATNWESTSQSHFRKLALELWKWPAGTILEVSAKVGPGTGQSEYAELQGLVSSKGLSLNASQATKTKTVLEVFVGRASQ